MRVKVEIKALDERGRGFAADMGIPFAYPGDVVEAELINKNKKKGRMISLVSPSPLRQDAPCKYFGRCGGCPWQGLKYEAQLKLKENQVRELFGECEPIVPSPDEYYYRNRMDFAFGPNFSVGLKDDRDNVIDIDKCLLMSSESNSVINRVRHFVSWKKLACHKSGIMRHVVVREGKNEKNIVLNIITSDKHEFPLEGLWEKISDAAAGISWSVNLSPADRSYGEIQETYGRDHLIESLLGIKFKIPVQSFFQTNIKQAEALLKIVSEFADLQGNETVLDLYAGTGSIGLSLAAKAGKVFGVEENEPAVALSRSNAELNGIGNFSAVAGRVEDIIESFGNEHEIVVLDPPRPGVNKKILKSLGEKKPRKIIYVSCNPFTQKHDVEIMKGYGYQIAKCRPVDMFPNTPHIENVILLEAGQAAPSASNPLR